MTFHENNDQRLFENNLVLRNYGAIRELEYHQAFSRRFGERYEIYRTQWDKSCRTELPDFPVHLDFELGDICNQACIMCPRNSETHKNIGYELNTKKNINYDMFCRIIEEASGYNLASINLGAFAEPLINVNLFRLVSFAAQKGVIDIRIITNGLLLSKFTDRILDSAITNLFVSLDASSSSTYEKIRGKGYDQVLESVKAFIKTRDEAGLIFPFVRVSFVEMKINKHEKDEFVNFWSNIVDFVDIQPGEDLSLYPTMNTNKEKRFDCLAPWQRLSVLSNGQVLPCCNFYGRYIPIGNAQTQSMHEIWHSANMMVVRNNLINDRSPVCLTCQSCSLLS